jgi:hypothetical protein
MGRERAYLGGVTKGRIQQALNRLANALAIFYDDSIVGPPLGASTVQAAIDALKGGGGADELVKVSVTDTTADFLQGKLVAGAGIVLSLLNGGADESLEISAAGTSPLGEVSCNARTEWTTYAEQTVEALPSLVPDVILTTTGAGDLQTAINSLGAGQVLEVRTDATYSPVTLPAVVGGYTVKAGAGYLPKITGAECVKLANGAADVTFSGFELYSATSPVPNSRGAFISFASEFSLVQRIIFANLYLHDVVGIAPGVMLSYFWNLYATPPNPATEMSSKLAFLDCTFVNAGNWNIEGASLNIRGFDQTYISRCSLDGGGQTTRAVQIQNCFNTIIQDSTAFNVAAGNGGEGFKLDQLGAWEATYGAWSTGVIRRCVAHDVAQGFDIDDYCAANVFGCTAYNCAEEGYDLDNDSYGSFICCSAFGNTDGFRFEPGSTGMLSKCMAFDNASNDYRMDNGYVPDVTNIGRTDNSGGVGGRGSVSLNDSTQDFLQAKIVGGAGVTTSVVNPGANEQLQIDAAGVTATQIACIYLNAPAVQAGIPITPNPAVTLTTFDTNGVAVGSTPDQANNRIVIGATGIYKVDFTISFGGTVSQNFRFHLLVNGVQKNELGIERKLGTGGDIGSAAANSPVALNAGDVLTISVDGTVGPLPMTLNAEHCNLNVFRLG